MHGHDPGAGQDFFVRYREDQEGTTEATGSLVAPFDGEHGWYWLNLHDGPVTITLTVTGFSTTSSTTESSNKRDATHHVGTQLRPVR